MRQWTGNPRTGTVFANFFRDRKHPRKQRKLHPAKFKKKALAESLMLCVPQLQAWPSRRRAVNRATAAMCGSGQIISVYRRAVQVTDAGYLQHPSGGEWARLSVACGVTRRNRPCERGGKIGPSKRRPDVGLD
jgi:hypothetical protein